MGEIRSASPKLRLQESAYRRIRFQADGALAGFSGSLRAADAHEQRRVRGLITPHGLSRATCAAMTMTPGRVAFRQPGAKDVLPRLCPLRRNMTICRYHGS